MADDDARGPWSFDRDLAEVFDANANVWLELQGARFFITGGTGFIGRWLLESLRYADQTLGLGVRAKILTRDPQGFARKAPHLAGYQAFEFIAGDVSDFVSPAGAYSHVIHAATDASGLVQVFGRTDMDLLRFARVVLTSNSQG